MDVHRPKPVHRLREFVGEIGIIVIGVLIALGGEQTVDALRWRADVAKARESLDRQAAEHLFAASERLGTEGCETRQLARMAAILRRTGSTPRIWGWMTGYLRPWSTSTWDAATASGAVEHMRADVREAYAEHFGLVVTMRALNQQEFVLASDLRSLGAPTVLSETARDRLASDVARLKGLNHMMALGSRSIVDQLHSIGVGLTREDQSRLKQELSAPCLMPDKVQPTS
jgi:hypothetical protein